MIVLLLLGPGLGRIAAAAANPSADLLALLPQHSGSGQQLHNGSGSTHNVLAKLSRQNRHRPPPNSLPTLDQWRKPWGPCPAELAASVNTSGLLPVDYFRPPGSNITFDAATRLAINMTYNCGGSVFFQTSGHFTSTVVVPAGTTLQGGGSSTNDQFTVRPQTSIYGPVEGPAFLVEHVTNIHFREFPL